MRCLRTFSTVRKVVASPPEAITPEALAPVIKGLIAEAAITAKSTHRKLAFPLLPDQFRPLLLLRGNRLDSSHPSHYRALATQAPERFHRVLTKIDKWPATTRSSSATRLVRSLESIFERVYAMPQCGSKRDSMDRWRCAQRALPGGYRISAAPQSFNYASSPQTCCHTSEEPMDEELSLDRAEKAALSAIPEPSSVSGVKPIL
jgi:hypothetical protein